VPTVVANGLATGQPIGTTTTIDSRCETDPAAVGGRFMQNKKALALLFDRSAAGF